MAGWTGIAARAFVALACACGLAHGAVAQSVTPGSVAQSPTPGSVAQSPTPGSVAQSLPPDIAVTRTINAPVADVWKAWTTTDGIESFFAPKAAKVEPWVGGAFELWFGVDMPEGSRGSEGCKVHSVKPMEQLVFEWNAPPTIPAIRPLRTLVYLDFKALPDNRTEVTLRNFGYGVGEDWDKTKAYFTRAWPAVMANLEKRFQPR